MQKSEQTKRNSLITQKLPPPCKISHQIRQFFTANPFFGCADEIESFTFPALLRSLLLSSLIFCAHRGRFFWREWKLLIIYGAMELVKTQNMLKIMKRSFRRSDANLPKGIHEIFHSFLAKGARQPFKPVTLNIDNAFGEENEDSHSDHFWR